MPKVKGPLFSVRARGSLGDAISFQGTRQGVRVEKRPRHKDRQSAPQLAYRAVFLLAVAYWHGLSAGEQALYNLRGHVLQMTGYNLCVREYLLGEVVPPAPPEGLSEAEILAVNGVETVGLLPVAYTSHAAIWAVDGG